MLKILIFLTIFFTISFGHRCEFSKDIKRSRPVLELSYLSQFGNFMIHYDSSGDNAPIELDENNNLVPDYIESVSEIAEESRNVLVNIMGYQEEPSDADGIYDIYVENSTRWGANFPESINGESYVIIDNDYAGENFDSDYCSDYLDKMRISVAHEYFHAIQRSYRPNYNQDHDFLLEMSSMWFERLMVDNCSDYLTFSESSIGILKNPTQPFDGSGVDVSNQANFGYSMALFGHYLSRITDSKGFQDERNSDIIRKIWEKYCYIQGSDSCPNNFTPREAIIETIEDFGDSFSRVWADFMSRNTLNGSYAYFNQDIYYHEDQQYIGPPTIDITDSINEGEVSAINLSLNPYSANIITIVSMDNMIINSTLYSNNLSQFDGYYSLRGATNTYNIINNNFSIVPSRMDLYHIVMTPKFENLIDVEFLFETSSIIPGCTNISSCNFNSEANYDDGSCYYGGESNTGVDGAPNLTYCNCYGEPQGQDDNGKDYCSCDGNITDCAGVCAGETAIDCAGECGGSAVKDCTGQCGGNAVVDCNGVCEGSAVVDCEGVCEGNNASCSYDLESYSFKVYPNPIKLSQDIIFGINTNSPFDFNDEASLNIKLYDILGQKLGSIYHSIQLNAGYNEIPLALKDYINSSGTYIIKATIDLEQYGYKKYSKKITVIK